MNTDLLHLYRILPIEDDKDIVYLNTSTITNITVSDTNTNWSEIHTTVRTKPYVVDEQIDELVADITRTRARMIK